MLPPSEGLERLVKGNLRFVSGETDRTRLSAQHRKELVAGQTPFAVILGCADSRVPVELVFDEGLGDLFVIRVAGNIVGPAQIGSIEYALEVLGVKLIVVLGHSGCGAVQATLDEIQNPSTQLSSGLQSIVSAIQIAVSSEQAGAPMALGDAVLANVRHNAAQLNEQSEIIQAHAKKGLRIVGAVYSLETGEVSFV